MSIRHRSRSPGLRRLAATALLLVACGGPAYADAIDGHWCDANGRRMSIAGPDITTPGGRQIRGQYSRHAFSFAVPDGEQGAGGTMSLLLMNEDTVRSTQSDPPETDIWHRCQDVSATTPRDPAGTS